MNLLDTLLPYQRRFVCSDRKRKFFLSSRQIGKSHVAAFIAICESVKRDNSLGLVISTGSRAAAEWLDKAEKFAQATQVLSNGTISYIRTSDRIELSNGSRILSLPSGNPQALRGYSASYVLIDEAFFIDNPLQVIGAISPTLTRCRDSKLIICSTPGSRTSPFYDIMLQAMDSDDWHFQSTTIYDAIQDGLDVDVDELRRLCPDPDMFSVEYECKFPNGFDDLIDRSLLQFHTDSPHIDEWFIGVDWGRTSDGTAIVVVGRDRKTGKCHLQEIVSLHNVEYARQLAVARDIFRKYSPVEMLGDAGGIGNPLMEELNRTVSTRIRPFTFTSKSKPDSFEFFRKCVFDRTLSISEEYRGLIETEISLFRKVVGESGNATYVARRQNGSHGDVVSALVLSLQAVRNHNIQAQAPVSYARGSVFSYSMGGQSAFV